MKTKLLDFKYMDIIDVHIELKRNYTVLNGESGTGKSYIFEILSQYAIENPEENILCINDDKVVDKKPQFLINLLKEYNDAIIFIDQADSIFMNTKIRDYVGHDRNNYYIISSRNFARQYTEWARPVITKEKISIKYKLNTI